MEISSSLTDPNLLCVWAFDTFTEGEGSDVEDGSYE